MGSDLTILNKTGGPVGAGCRGAGIGGTLMRADGRRGLTTGPVELRPGGATRVAGKPRLLVIERDGPTGPSTRDRLGDQFEVVTARSMARAVVLLREQE